MVLNIICMFSTIHGRKIWYTDHGKGSPVVLVHGYLESSEAWNGFGDRLSASFRVISADLPGHGRSEAYGDTHSMELMADVIRELLDNLGLKKVFIIGHSLGGYVTLAFLDLYPQYLSGYCLFHSHPLADTPEVIEKRQKDIATVNSGNKDLMYPDNIKRMFAQSNLDKFSEAVKRSEKIASAIPEDGIVSMLNGMMKRPSRVKIMEEGRVPCLWILGTMDSHIPFEAMQEKVRLPSNAEVVVLSNSGHLGFVEEEDLSVSAVTGFINKLTF